MAETSDILQIKNVNNQYYENGLGIFTKKRPFMYWMMSPSIFAEMSFLVWWEKVAVENQHWEKLS